jgi:Zn-dependent protease with chaperone function
MRVGFCVLVLAKGEEPKGQVNMLTADLASAHESSPRISLDRKSDAFPIQVRFKQVARSANRDAVRTIVAALMLSAVALLGACATSPPRRTVTEAPPPHSVTQPRARIPPSGAMRAVTWKGIQPGRTTRSEIEARFGRGSPAGGWSRYEIDQITTLVAYTSNNRVKAIRLPVSVEIDQQTLRARFGAPSRTRRANSLLVWEYDTSAVSIEFASGSTTAGMVEIDSRLASADALSVGLGQLVPIRPPLRNMKERRAAVAAAMGLKQGARYSLVTSDSEWRQARQYYAELAARSLIMRDEALQSYLDGLLARLASVTPTAPFEWKIAALSSPIPNAFNLGGGIILVTRGLFTPFSDEGELAYIVSHEMAHQLLHHVATATSRSQVANVLVLLASIAASAATGVPAAGQGVQAVTGGVARATMAHFSRADEATSDTLAVTIMESAGYDPMQSVGALQTLEKMSRKERRVDSPLFQTHPNPEMRVAEIKELLSRQRRTGFSSTLVNTQEFIEFRARYRTDLQR